MSLKLNQLESVIEAILFLAGEAVSIETLSKAIEMDKATTKAIVLSLMDRYSAEKRGLKIVPINDGFQMCTAPWCFSYIQDLYKKKEKQGLSQSLLETLAIIAYKQPITKSGIEEIRGVNADHAVSKLLERNLIEDVGRLNAPGRPVLYGTTDDFLRYFGLQSKKDLPDLSGL